MSELKQRKAKETDDSKDRKSSKDIKDNEEIKIRNANNKTFKASDARSVAEKHRQEIGKKMFKRSLKRMMLIGVAFAVLYIYQWIKTDQVFTPFVTTSDQIENVPFVKQVQCSEDYAIDRQQFPMCVPKVCGRLVIDNLINDRESEILLSLFKKALLLNNKSVNGSAYILGEKKAFKYENQFLKLIFFI